MHFTSTPHVSTRGRVPTLGFEGVLLAGLASDGDLYVPQQWPTFGPDARREPSTRLLSPPVPEGSHAGGATRNVNVTGPSLVRVTCMRAPNRPVSTSGCNARARSTA